MKIKVKGSGIAIIELEEGDDSASGQLQAIATDLKQSITGLNGIVTELSNIVLNGLHEQVTNLSTSVQMLSTSVTMVNEKFESITESFSSYNVTNIYNQYFTMPCPPAANGEGGEKKEESELDSFLKIFKDLYEVGKSIKDLVDDIKNAWKLSKAIKGGNPEEIEAAESVIEKDAIKGVAEDVAESIGEAVLGDVGEVLAGLFVAMDPAAWIIAGVALVGAGIYEYYKHTQEEGDKKQDNTSAGGNNEQQPNKTITANPPDSYHQQFFSGTPELGTGGVEGQTYTYLPPGQAPLGTFGPGGVNSGQGNTGAQNGTLNSPNTIYFNGSGPMSGTGPTTGNGFVGGQGLPILPMPSLCEQIRECLQGYNPQAMPISPMYPGMNSSYSAMKITYNYSFGSVAAFSGTSNMATSGATAGGNFQAQFIEILTQAVQDSKVAADVH